MVVSVASHAYRIFAASDIGRGHCELAEAAARSRNTSHSMVECSQDCEKDHGASCTGSNATSRIPDCSTADLLADELVCPRTSSMLLSLAHFMCTLPLH
jgi:hypothetical protein